MSCVWRGKVVRGLWWSHLGQAWTCCCELAAVAQGPEPVPGARAVPERAGGTFPILEGNFVLPSVPTENRPALTEGRAGVQGLPCCSQGGLARPLADDKAAVTLRAVCASHVTSSVVCWLLKEML